MIKAERRLEGITGQSDSVDTDLWGRNAQGGSSISVGLASSECAHDGKRVMGRGGSRT